MEKFNLKKLNEAERKEKYCVEVSNRFAALENLYAEVEINSAWGTNRENISISAKECLDYYELKKHKPWFSFNFICFIFHKSNTGNNLGCGSSYQFEYNN
jgi:hypothetical protein